MCISTMWTKLLWVRWAWLPADTSLSLIGGTSTDHLYNVHAISIRFGDTRLLVSENMRGVDYFGQQDATDSCSIFHAT